MVAYSIFYSATIVMDYRFITQPESLQVPTNVLLKFQKRIKGLLSNERPIHIPKWLFDKEYDHNSVFILWGMACQNKEFSEMYSNDGKHRPIQCFIGTIIIDPDENLNLPYDLNTFQVLFNKVMEKEWLSRNTRPSVYQLDIKSMAADNYIQRKSGENLNYKDSICRIFPHTPKIEDSLFSEALSAKKSVSIASGVFYRSEVTTAEYDPLFNAIQISEGTIIKDFPVERICPRCKKDSYSFIDGICEECYKEENEKKSNSSKLYCRGCGMKTVNLTNGLCQSCYHASESKKCRKCGNLVEYVYPNGQCEECHTRAQSHKQLIRIITLIIILLCTILSKYWHRPRHYDDIPQDSSKIHLTWQTQNKNT